MGSLPWRFVFMVVAVVPTKNIVEAVVRQELSRQEAAVESHRYDFATLYDACKSSLQTKQKGGMRTCAWTERQQMNDGNCPVYNFVTGYTEGHIRGCLLGRNIVVCSCENREECFQEVDIQDTNRSNTAVRDELQCIRDQWRNQRVKREDDTGNESITTDAANTPDDSTRPTTPTTTTKQTTTISEENGENGDNNNNDDDDDDDDDVDETEEPTTTPSTTTTRRTPRTTTTTEKPFEDYTDFVDRRTKGPSEEETTKKDDEDEEHTTKETTERATTRSTKTTKATKSTKKPKEVDPDAEDSTIGIGIKSGRTIFVNENYTAFILTILGAVASTLLLLIIIVIKMWFKLERRERLREIKSEARRTRRPSRSRRR